MAKVYCNLCKWHRCYHNGEEKVHECIHEDNKAMVDTWLMTKLQQRVHPKERNQWNNCKWYEDLPDKEKTLGLKPKYAPGLS